MKCRFVILFFVTTISYSLAQNNIIIKGSCTDNENGKPLPFSSIYNKELSYYTIADSAGNFQLKVNSSSANFYLVISSIGYFNDTINFENLNTEIYKSIRLKPNPENLPAASIDAMTAKTIVRKAIEHIDENYSDSTFIFNATYAQYHFEKPYGQNDEKAVRLIFADVNVLQQFNEAIGSKKVKEKVKVNTVLRSNVFEKNKEEHGDHFVDLLEESPVYHTTGTVLNIKAINFYRFTFDKEYDENQTQYKINFELLSSDKPKLQRGYLIIDKNSFAITTYYKEEYNNSNVSRRIIYSSTVPYKWNFNYGSVMMNYEIVNARLPNGQGKYQLKNCFMKYQHQLTDNKTHWPAYIISENFELAAGESYYDKISSDELKKYSEFSNLYSSKTIYDEIFYQQFLKYDFHFLNNIKQQQLIDYLGNTLPLYQQFKNNSKQLNCDSDCIRH